MRYLCSGTPHPVLSTCRSEACPGGPGSVGRPGGTSAHAEPGPAPAAREGEGGREEGRKERGREGA